MLLFAGLQLRAIASDDGRPALSRSREAQHAGWPVVVDDASRALPWIFVVQPEHGQPANRQPPIPETGPRPASPEFLLETEMTVTTGGRGAVPADRSARIA